MFEKAARKLEPIRVSTLRALTFIGTALGGVVATQEAGGIYAEGAAGIIGGAVVATAFEGKEISRGKVVACIHLGAIGAAAAVALYSSYKTGDMVYRPSDLAAGIAGGYGASLATDGGTVAKPQQQV